jgi:hypothetical protein
MVFVAGRFMKKLDDAAHSEGAVSDDAKRRCVGGLTQALLAEETGEGTEHGHPVPHVIARSVDRQSGWLIGWGRTEFVPAVDVDRDGRAARGGASGSAELRGLLTRFRAMGAKQPAGFVEFS